MSECILQTSQLTMKFGGLTAVDRCCIKVEKNELVGVIGPNGAGKTTLFNTITGIYAPTSGCVKLNGADIQGRSVPSIANMGIARTFQNIRLFKELSVLDNIRLAGHSNIKYGLLSSIFRTKAFKKEEEELHQRSLELLRIMKLDSKKDHLAKNLPYGEQRRLEIARALATNPKVLLLDEPAAGMNPKETAELGELIKWIRDEFDTTVILIEHDMGLVMNVCERIYVVDYGAIIAEGNPLEIQSNPRVIEAYLGADDEI